MVPVPGLFILSLILVIVAIVAIAWFAIRRRPVPASVEPDEVDHATKKSSGGPTSRQVAGWVSVGALVLALVTMFFSSATIVSTKNVGIETSFGRPVGSLPNGFHLIPPWNKVTEMDAAIQTDNHVKGHAALDCITVRIAHGHRVRRHVDPLAHRGAGRPTRPVPRLPRLLRQRPRQPAA